MKKKFSLEDISFGTRHSIEIPIWKLSKVFIVFFRWSKSADELQNTYDNLTGDVLISAGVIAYLGAFTAGFRQDCTRDWTKLCKVLTICKSALCIN